MVAPASAQTYSIVHVFGNGTPTNDGQNPCVPLITGLNGNFYGMTTQGGTADHGTVFMMTPQGVVTILHSFEDGSVTNDGFNPSTLMQTPDGTLWGTTTQGGTSYPSVGAVFKITTQGVYSIVHAFQGTSDGSDPSGMVLGTDGNFYGTSTFGQTNGGHGVFWKMTPQGVLTGIYTFQANGSTDGSGPSGGLVEGTDGNFYGITFSGLGETLVGGMIYSMTPAGVRTIIHGFADGTGRPAGGLMAASDGNMYGMTAIGGTYNDGTVFKLASQSVFSTLYNFGTNAVDGADPVGNVILASDGNLYGVTEEIYSNGAKGGGGLVFQLNPQGQMTVAYNFDSFVANDGTQPTTGLTQGPDGNLYGTTYYGGSRNDDGTIYEEAITASAPPPVITGLLTRSGAVGTAFPEYQIIASNSPQSYAATGLPPGLSIDTSLGVITGTPTAGGTFPVTISATNSPGGTTTATLTITVTGPLGPPTIVNGPPPSGALGTPYSFTYQVESYPAATFSVTSGTLPTGLTLSSTGVISGTPTAVGVNPVTITASNGTAPNATQTFSFSLSQPTSITSATSATFAVGQADSFKLTASGSLAVTFSAMGLPGWATLNQTTGVISGTPPNATGSPFTIDVTAANGDLPNATQVFTLSVESPQPFAGNPTATPENDGIPNLLKYVYDINPSTPMGASDYGALPATGTTTVGGTRYLTLTYRENALVTGININVQTSPDLETWTTVTNPTLLQTGNDPITGDPIMQAEVPVTGSKEFLRLNVTEP